MGLREFYFFDVSDKRLFIRNDAESANWSVDELNANFLFPYDPQKIITRGMRIAFEDDDGVLQPFEIRKVRTYEPDHYQEITAEHIIISELTDAHTRETELTNVTAQSALTTVLNFQPSVLTGAKRWTIGSVSASGTSSGDIGMGSVWQHIRSVEQNWNVYILPRVTWNDSGITGRYLDIVPAAGVWHGLRLSIDKNMDETGVTVDDTEVKTALYAYGGNAYEISENQLDKEKEPITLVGYTWPGKPAGASINSAEGYIEDTAATAAYGRNGVPRFGFYQNGDIQDQAVLAQKAWEALQATKNPTVTVDCMVHDLYRLGYHDEKIRLHDTALIELRPTNEVLSLEIIKLSVDLLDPTATRPTIGQYVPNIVYIQRDTMDKAAGGGRGGGGSISGRCGGETESEAEWSEFQAEFVVNNTILSYHATQVDRDNKILKAAGLDIDANGAIIYATDNINKIGSRFNAQADKIGMVVEVKDGQNVIKAAGIVSAINADKTTSTMIQGDHVTITGETGILGNLQVAGVVVADDIFSETATHNNVYCNTLTTDSNIYCDYDLVMASTSDISTGTITAEGLVTCNLGLTVSGGDFNADDMFADSLEVTEDITAAGTVYGDNIDAATYDGYQVNGTSIGLGNVVKSFGTPTSSGGQISIPWTKLDGTAGTPINFNIADTQYFIDSVAAAKLEGWNAACDKVTRVSNTVYGPQKNSYGNYTQKYKANYSASSYSASSHSHSYGWMKVDGFTFRSNTTYSLTNYTGDAQLNIGTDSYTPSSYSSSSFSWTDY